MKNLQNLFKINRVKYHSSPLSFTEYFNIISDNIKLLNVINPNKFVKHYNLYVELFNHHSKLISPIREVARPTSLGFYSISNSNINYYITRGWSKFKAIKMLKDRQSTWRINNVMLSNECDKNTAIDIVTNRSKLVTAKIKNRQDYDDICKSKGNSNRWEFYIDKINPETNLKYTELESREKIRIKQSMGPIKFWKDVRDGRKYYTAPTSLQYFLNNGISMMDAKKALYERQHTFSLDICIEKHGEIKGLKIFNKRQEKWQNNLNSKSVEELLDIKIRKLSNHNVKFYSNESAIFFDDIIDVLRSDYKLELNDIRYKEKEHFIVDENNKIFFYDLCIPSLNIIIEYNGSHVHPNKHRLSEHEWNNWKSAYSKESSDFVYKKDQYKLNLAVNNGYKIYEIWDTDNKIDSIDMFCKIIKTKYDKSRKDNRT